MYVRVNGHLKEKGKFKTLCVRLNNFLSLPFCIVIEFHADLACVPHRCMSHLLSWLQVRSFLLLQSRPSSTPELGFF